MAGKRGRGAPGKTTFVAAVACSEDGRSLAVRMTSVALIVAMVPLLTAAGPGAESRFAIGLTIAAGLGIGTLLTVFVLPAFYCLLARDHAARRAEGGEAAEAPA